MLINLFNQRLSPLMVFLKRSVVVRSNFNLANEMKLFNDNKQFNKTLQLFDKYKKNNTKTISSFIITQALKACAHLGDIQYGSTIHHLISSRIKDDHYISASLIHMYMQCGDVTNAQLVYNKTRKKTMGIYGAMMTGYIKKNQPNKAIELFNTVEHPNEILFNLFFNACAQLKSKQALHLVKNIFKDMPKMFYSNPYILSSLLDALMKCGDVKQAQLIFDSSKNKSSALYGAMMKGYVENNLLEMAIELFKKIPNPSDVNLIVLFNACAQLGTSEALDLIEKVSSQMPKSFYSNPRLFTSLLDAFMNCGDIKHSELLFSKSTNKILFMYGVMMKGYIKNNQANKAIDLFNEIDQPDEIILNLLFNACAHLRTTESLNLMKKVSSKMPKSYYSNPILLTSLLDACIKCGDMEHAQSIFHSSTSKSLAMYGAMMTQYNKDENAMKSLNLFFQMKNEGFQGDIVIYLCVIKSLSKLGDYSLCQSIVKEIPDCFRFNHQIENALIDMWGKSGHINEAKEIFEKISRSDQFGYTAMINCYGLNGMGMEAVQLYHQMPKEFIHEVTHVCVINACSHSGLVNEARLIFENIPIKTEKIYCTMIDCLSRGSLFEEAQQLIDGYERVNSPVSSMYMALLSGARNVKNSYLSQNIYDRMKKLFPQMTSSLTSATVLLANVYASSGDIDKASNIRHELYQSGAKKKIGLSWTVINGEVFEFRAHDRSHPRSSEIYIELEKISSELISHGHQYDSSWITRPLHQDETVASVLCGHSERLAIAFNFVVNPNATRIQVTKNLRVCGDCHRAIKLIALIRQCQIIVRDANRIHHFHINGQCSCNDYF